MTKRNFKLVRNKKIKVTDKKLLLLKIKNLEINMRDILIDNFFLKEFNFFINYISNNYSNLEELFEVPSNYKKFKKELYELEEKYRKFLQLKSDVEDFKIDYENISNYKNFIKECKYCLRYLNFNKLQLWRIYEKYRFNYNPSIYKKLDNIKSKILRYKNILIKENRFFVISIAKQYRQYTQLTIEDIIQEGMIGLIKAINMIDPRKDIELTTYAYNWVKHFISRAICNQSKLIRVPIHVIERMNKIKRIEEAFILEKGYKPSIKELVDLSGYSYKAIKSLDRYQLDILFLSEDSSIEKMGCSIGDDEFHLNELRNNIDNILTEEEKSVIFNTFGISNEKLKNYNKSKINSIKNNALNKLKESYGVPFLSVQ